LITRLECCTREAEAASAPPVSRRVRAYWDVALGLGAIAYLLFVLFDDVESPLLSLALLILVAHELFEPHVRNR
jgi:hypothetical protein